MMLIICDFPSRVWLSAGHYGKIYCTKKTEGNTMTAKKETELQSFMDNINKKDKLNGHRIVFNFVKRKRK